MRVAIITNINGIGLQKDAELLSAKLAEWGHQTATVQWNQPTKETGFDLAIWLEVIDEHLIGIAKRHYLFVNPEWLRADYVRPIQRHVERVFAKTREAERVLRQKFNGVQYVGFLTEDHRVEGIKRERKFLHIGGNGGFRNTQAIISAWREYRYWDDSRLGELSVVTSSTTVSCEPTPGVTFYKRVTDDELRRLQNSHLFHLYPSAYEGFGQALHEAESVGAVILSTDAAPMNESPYPFLIPSIKEKKYNFGTLHDVDPAAIREAVPKMAALPLETLARMSCESRARFERGNKEFVERFRPYVDDAAVVNMKPRLALLGNFEPPHSTENDLLWTLKDMGYDVASFQENQDTTEDILAGMRSRQLLIYVHTHGWTTPGRLGLLGLINALRAQGKKTCSFHLDLYWGLNAGDQRENRVGEHPFWKTDRVFTADGGNDERFRERGVNHHWLPPGVIRRDCEPGEFQPDLAVDVGFVGAEGYHAEYPFRGELIQFLREVYGVRFRRFDGFRGARLNNLYASIRVVVGDSCFGGADRYWSDRVPETLGRGGFLVHPESRGLAIPGLVTFPAGDLYALQDRIDYFLKFPVERERLQKTAMNWVRSRETYHQRMAELLRVMECR